MASKAIVADADWRGAQRRHPLALFFVWFLTVFLVLFPKGGLKIGIVPITWGYLGLALSGIALLPARIVALPLLPSSTTAVALICLLPMQLLLLYVALFNGIGDPPFAVSTMTGLLVLPWMFLTIFPPFLRFVDGGQFAKYITWSVLLAALWGIFLFFLHPITGHFIEIPYLTVNAADFGQLEKTKFINRGLFFKLISTYNNGNVYGVATLIILPLYGLLEKVRWRRNLVKVALLLTLSRTVWAGLLLLEVMPLVLLMARQVKTFPLVYLRSAAGRVTALVSTSFLVLVALTFNANSLTFLFDPTVGGRSSFFVAFREYTLLPAKPLAGFKEVLYVTAWEDYGVVGLLSLTLLLFSPLFLAALDRKILNDPMRRAALKGLVLYIALGAVDGALSFIPVMAFYWFVYMIMLCGWPPGTSTRKSQSLPALAATA